VPGGEGYHINACNQCGECIDICPVGALKKDARGIVQLEKNSCVGCMMCVGFCPTASLFFNVSAGIEPFKCIACGACVQVCPTEAIEIIES
jgi:ferredoxin